MILITQIDLSIFRICILCKLCALFPSSLNSFVYVFFLTSRMNPNNQNNHLYMMLSHMLYGRIAPCSWTPPCSKESRPKYSPLTPSPIGSPDVYCDYPKADSETSFLLIQAKKKLELLTLHEDDGEESSEDGLSVFSGDTKESMEEEESKQ